MSKKLLNAPSDAVLEMLQGWVRSNPTLGFLDGSPEVKVVFDPRHPKDKVALISGGGSGHEPAHAGYVGAGMLAAAVCGEVFASPSARAVLAAIKTVTGPGGCLLIVKNYTGDRLHFGQAAEQAKAEGMQVDMVVVGEDCAIDDPLGAGRRGLAGTVFVHKIAGALAAAGKPLAQVAEAARKLAASLGTMGVALKVCTLPGRPQDSRLPDDEVEVGLGIHGEPGRSTMKVPEAEVLTELMLQQIISYQQGSLGLAPGAEVALMVNNLGATTLLELNVVANEALKLLEQRFQLKVARVFVGSFMTSLDMAGASLTLLKITSSDILNALDTPVRISAWPAGPTHVLPLKKATPLPPIEENVKWARPASVTADGALLEVCITAAAKAVIAAEPLLTEWDAKAGDGDCGTTLKQGAEAILKDLQNYPLNSPADTALALAATISGSMGGTSGALYHMFASAAGSLLCNVSGSGNTSASWAAALKAGTAAVQKYGGANKGDRTMLDALLPACEALEADVAPGAAAASIAARAAMQGAHSTMGMAGRVGRASYVPAQAVQECPDPGAMAVALWLDAVAKAVA